VPRPGGWRRDSKAGFTALKAAGSAVRLAVTAQVGATTTAIAIEAKVGLGDPKPPLLTLALSSIVGGVDPLLGGLTGSVVTSTVTKMGVKAGGSLAAAKSVGGAAGNLAGAVSSAGLAVGEGGIESHMTERTPTTTGHDSQPNEYGSHLTSLEPAAGGSNQRAGGDPHYSSTNRPTDGKSLAEHKLNDE